MSDGSNSDLATFEFHVCVRVPARGDGFVYRTIAASLSPLEAALEECLRIAAEGKYKIDELEVVTAKSAKTLVAYLGKSKIRAWAKQRDKHVSHWSKVKGAVVSRLKSMNLGEAYEPILYMAMGLAEQVNPHPADSKSIEFCVTNAIEGCLRQAPHLLLGGKGEKSPRRNPKARAKGKPKA